MKQLILILLLAISVFAEKEFNTFAICTFVNDMEYCAVGASKAVATEDTSHYYIKSSHGESYTYDIDLSTQSENLHLDSITITVSGVTERINDVEGKNYIMMKSEHSVVLADAMTGCYIKKYFEGTPDKFYQSFKFITIDIVDFFEFYEQCLKTLMEND